ncbi:hypothetical protein ACRALDRAFT_1082986 [Sodiomyces alcalophilus JCM 7366]|uniref:uncharacterized protein n=1 Tax=Sodiomyces alcalophilus JCM 7366 TaxID=591952 RepID=UPI0039B37BCB
MSQTAPDYPPSNYKTPPFPSLSLEPRDLTDDHRWSLYYLSDIWRFTVLWTIIFYAAVHLAAAAIAIAMQGGKKRSRMHLWVAPIIYVGVAMAQGLMAGSIVGVILAAVYNAGFFSMSTWLPALWGLINVLVLIISSFSIQGAL